tara:strand:- start:199 stop:477 length:279 start_codon:yes stop_codon:yes gene_type:complete
MAKVIVNGIETDISDSEHQAWLDTLNEDLATLLNRIRQDRNSLLAQTDWMANSDVTMSDEWKTYRQELRDITEGIDTEAKAKNVVWPTKPGE